MNTDDNPDSLTQERWNHFIRFLLFSLALSALSEIISLVNPADAPAGALLFSSGLGLAVEAWLVAAMYHKKSWARKTFIAINLVLPAVFSLLIVCCSDPSIDDEVSNLPFNLVDVAGWFVSLYCVYLCFTKGIRNAFLADSKRTGAEAKVNRQQCLAYIVAFIVSQVVSSIVSA